MGVEYSYVFMDKLKDDDKDKALDDLERWNPRTSFPTIVINDDRCIVGFKEDEIKEALGL